MRKSRFFVFLHMLKKRGFLLCLLFALVSKAQDVRLPVDLRQHNVMEYNSSVFNPVMSFNANSKNAMALWSRWQWQQIDTDPTTLFFNYSRQLNEDSAAGIGFFQHNTGIFVNTGGLLNYAYLYTVSPNFKIGVGLNLFGFKQVLANTRILFDPDTQNFQLRNANDFIIQASPGLLFDIRGVQLGFSAENLFDYNFALNERQSSADERIYLFSGGYTITVTESNAIVRPTIYYKSVPFQDSQIGISTLFSTKRFWAQAGYNSFYGVSVGGGARFFKKVAIGALVELGTDKSLDEKDTTFELTAAYHFGKSASKKIKKQPEPKELIVASDPAEKEKVQQKTNEESDRLLAERAREQAADSIEHVRQLEQKARIAREKDSLTKLDIERIRRIEAAEAAQKRLDSARGVEAEKSEMAKRQQQELLDKEAEETRRRIEKRKMDSLATISAQRIRRKEAAAAAQRRLDSINNVLATKERLGKEPVKEQVVLERNEKYEEVKTEAGLAPGFYLIANVFGTKKYYNAFMQKLKNKGLQPKSFLRSLNNYQYVYLARYDSMAAARNARNSKFSGRYTDKTWIFRVVE